MWAEWEIPQAIGMTNKCERTFVHEVGSQGCCIRVECSHHLILGGTRDAQPKSIHGSPPGKRRRYVTALVAVDSGSNGCNMSAERGHLEGQNQAGPVSKTDPIRTCQIRLIGFGPRAFPSNTPLTGACPNFLHTRSRSLSHHRTRPTSRHPTSLECLNDRSKVPSSNTHIEQTQTLQLETRRRARWRR